MSSFNKFKSTTVYGSFYNTNLGALSATAVFDGVVSCNSTLQTTDVTLNGNITANSVTISPTELSYLNDCSSNIQGQINSVNIDISSNYLKIVDASSNYLKITDASNNYVKQNKLNTVSTYNQVSSTIVYGSFLNLDTSVQSPGPWLPYPANGTAQSYFQGTVRIDDGLICSTGLFEMITLSGGDGLIVNNGTGNVIVSPLELSRLDGVTSPIQNQINNIITYYYTGSQVDTKLTEYLKIVDASNNYLQKTSLLPTLLTADVQVNKLEVMSSILNFYNSGTQNASIYNANNYLNINALGILNVNILGINLIGFSVILGNGFRGRQGTSGTTIGNDRLNLWWNGTNLQLWVETTNIGNFTICDYRIKENFQPASNVLDRLCSINMFNYETKDISIFKKKGTQIGFFAHELKDAFPELNNIVEGEKDAVTEDGDIQPQTVNAELVHLLMRSIQELNEKVNQLSNRIVELENKSL